MEKCFDERDIPGGKSVLDPKKQTQFYMSSYDPDKFKRYVFESKFLDIFDIDKDGSKRYVLMK